MSVLALNDKVKQPSIDKSNFDLSHVHSLTGSMGRLIPVLTEEVIPGDNWKLRVNHILRFLPMAGPINHRVDVFFHAFFVPNRIVWSSWEEFITGRSANETPKINLRAKTIAEDSIGSYMGIPSKIYPNIRDIYVNKLPLLGYVQIYNDYYRNRVIQDKVDATYIDYNTKVFERNWRKDYFTSQVPFPQLGNPAAVAMDITYLNTAKTTNPQNAEYGLFSRDAIDQGYIYLGASQQSTGIENIYEISVDVNELRYAYAMQDWLVRMLKSGDDYADQLKLVFGVNSSDARLQRAEYIGGYQSPVIINDVTAVAKNYDSQGEVVSPLGEQGGQAHTYGNSEEISCYVEEHGYIHVIMSVIPKSAHYGGIARHFLRDVPTDFYFPQFAYLPEQETKSIEVSVVGDVDDDHTFGYIERYAEYKHRNDKISGFMATDFKHLNFANIYSTHQTLNSTFIKSVVRDDAFAIDNATMQFFGQVGFQIDAERPMPFNVDGINII